MDLEVVKRVLEGLRVLLTAGSFPEFAGATIENAKANIGGSASFTYKRGGKPVAVDLIILQAPPATGLSNPPAFTLQVEQEAGLFYLDDRGHPWELASGNAPLAPYPSKLRELGLAISAAGTKKPA